MEENQGVEQPTENLAQEETQVKTFTQEEVNNIVKERLAKANKGIPSKEELTKYNEWKESQKTQEDKYNELVKSSNEKETTISNLKMENEVLKAGITDEDEIEFIVYKVSKMEGDFKDNLNEYLESNKKFIKKQEKATGINNNSNVVEQEDGVMAILKSKYPDINF